MYFRIASTLSLIHILTEEERALIEEKMQQIPTLNLSAYARKMLIDGYIITLDLQEVDVYKRQDKLSIFS